MKKRAHKIFCFLTASFFSYAVFINPVYANPQDGVVVGGSASIQTDANTLTVIQNTDKAIINWQQFNIASGEKTVFLQPNSNSLILNRVVGGDPSQIFGQISANGRVVLVNPAGIYMGNTARINVNSLIATTANISDANFMAGNLQFSQDPAIAKSIINEGEIHAAAEGLVALVAPAVANNGIIQANLGKVALAAGNAFTVDLYGDQLVNFAVNSQVMKAATDQNGAAMTSAVSNKGKIIADGGKVLMSANVAQHVVQNVINLEGVAQARSVSSRNGEIILSGGDNGVVRVAGELDVSGKAAGQKGGSIKVLGEKIKFENARLDASGDIGGGSVLIGGDYQGGGDVPHAQALYFGADASINADAITQGNGGKIILWSDESTRAYGALSARGGLYGGNGGLIETSSKNWLDVTGISIFANAAAGNAGLWLIDPSDVIITDTQAESNVNFSADGWFAQAPASSISFSTLNTALNAGTSVLISTDSGAVGSGNITIGVIGEAGFIHKSSGGEATLTFNAANNINVNRPIISSTGNLNIIFNPNQTLQTNYNGAGGNISLSSEAYIDTNGGNLTFNGAVVLPNVGVGGTQTHLDSGVGTITFNGAVDGNAELRLFGSNLILNAAMGSNSALSSVVINSDAATLNGNITTRGNGIYSTGTHFNLTSSVTLTSSGADVAGNGIISLFAPTITGNNYNLTLNNPTGTINIDTGNLSGLASFTVNAANGYTVLANNTNIATNNGAITFNSPVQIFNAAVLNSGTGSINFTDTLDSYSGNSADLTITQAGHLTFATAVGATTSLDDLQINNTNILDLNGQLYANALSGNVATLNINDHRVDINDVVSNLASNGATVNLAPIYYGRNLSFTKSINLNSSGTASFMSLSSSAALGLSGNFIADEFNFNAPVTLLGATALTANTGDLLFNSSIQGSHDLTLSASNGDITFVGAAGSYLNRLGTLWITAARNVTAQNALEVSSFIQSSGTGTTTFGGTGVNATQNVLISTGTIKGAITANGAAVLLGRHGIGAQVNVGALTVGGLNGGTLMGSVANLSGAQAALRSQLATGSQGLFTVNGITLGIYNPALNINSLLTDFTDTSSGDNSLDYPAIMAVDSPAEINLNTSIQVDSSSTLQLAAKALC